MSTVQFHTLWENHPVVTGNTPVLDRAVYENQCAINLSVSLINSGIALDNFRGTLSWQKDKPKCAIRAQELADWLKFRRFPTCLRTLKPENFEDQIKGRTGIIFFQNYWGRGSQGDHIDLWNGMRMTSAASWIRIHFNVHWQGIWDDFHKAEGVWFWSIS